jgi:hypothetical protein
VSTYTKCLPTVVRCCRVRVHAYLGALSTLTLLLLLLLRHAALPSLSAYLGSFRDWRRWHVVMTFVVAQEDDLEISVPGMPIP